MAEKKNLLLGKQGSPYKILIQPLKQKHYISLKIPIPKIGLGKNNSCIRKSCPVKIWQWIIQASSNEFH